MSGNTAPIYSRVGDIQWGGPLTAANTALDGTGTVTTVFAADATNGGFVRSLRFKPAATSNTTVTVARVFINNGGANSTAANNVFFDEISLPATAASATQASQPYDLPLNIALPPGYKINVTLGTASSNGWYVTALGGKY